MATSAAADAVFRSVGRQTPFKVQSLKGASKTLSLEMSLITSFSSLSSVAKVKRCYGSRDKVTWLGDYSKGIKIPSARVLNLSPSEPNVTGAQKRAVKFRSRAEDRTCCTSVQYEGNAST